MFSSIFFCLKSSCQGVLKLRLLQSLSLLLVFDPIKNVHCNVSVGSKCVLVSRTDHDSLLNFWTLYMVISKKVASVHDISPVNLIVGWCLFAFSMNIFDDISAGVLEGNYAVDITFPS